MKRVLIALVALVAFSSQAAFAGAPNMLEGKTFQGEIKNAGHEKPDPDTFIFKDGNFRSTACDQYGYTSAPFHAMESPGKTGFTATTKNTHGATISWDGWMKGDELGGTAVMTDDKGKKTDMTFHGTLHR